MGANQTETPFQIGADYPVWWNTNRPMVGGFYPARIIAVEPYRGPYAADFSHVLTLDAPTTRNGALRMTVKA